MKKENYFIKASYIPNKMLETMDNVSNGVYWDKKKAYSAGFHQFYVYKYLTKLINKHGFEKLVDVGCGVGTKLSFVNKKCPNVNIIGIDQEAPIKFCKETYKFGKWFSDDFENPKEDDRSLNEAKGDILICSDVIEHVLNPDKLLAYLKTKVRPDGYIIISTPERDLSRGKSHNVSPNKHHIREWNREELTKYLTESGFKIEDYHLEYPVKIVLNRIFVSNFLRWLLQRTRQKLSFKYNQVFLLKLK